MRTSAFSSATKKASAVASSSVAATARATATCRRAESRLDDDARALELGLVDVLDVAALHVLPVFGLEVVPRLNSPVGQGAGVAGEPGEGGVDAREGVRRCVVRRHDAMGEEAQCAAQTAFVVFECYLKF